MSYYDPNYKYYQQYYYDDNPYISPYQKRLNELERQQQYWQQQMPPAPLAPAQQAPPPEAPQTALNFIMVDSAEEAWNYLVEWRDWVSGNKHYFKKKDETEIYVKYFHTVSGTAKTIQETYVLQAPLQQSTFSDDTPNQNNPNFNDILTKLENIENKLNDFDVFKNILMPGSAPIVSDDDDTQT